MNKQLARQEERATSQVIACEALACKLLFFLDQLRDVYFGHYTWLLYVAQTECKTFWAKVVQAAAELELNFEFRYVGYGEFTDFILGLPSQGFSSNTQKISCRIRGAPEWPI